MDIFGTALVDYHQGRTDKPFLIRRSDGFVDEHSVGIWFANDFHEAEQPFTDELSGRVLDVGCGAGRHVLAMQEQDIDVTGVDISQGAISVCQSRGCEIVTVDDIMRPSQGLRSKPFDVISLFGNNIGIGGCKQGVVTMLQNLRKLIDQEGKLLIAALDVSKTEKLIHKQYQLDNLAKGLPPGQINMRMEYDSSVGPWFDWLHPLPAELERYAAAASWQMEVVYRSKDGPYSAILQPV